MPADTAPIVTLTGRPELLPVVAGWLWEEFLRWDGYTLEQTRDILAGLSVPFRCLVLLEDGAPAATASLAAEDLDERPQLSPWLAGVYVVPEARGRGLARALVSAVEEAARSAGIGRSGSIPAARPGSMPVWDGTRPRRSNGRASRR